MGMWFGIRFSEEVIHFPNINALFLNLYHLHYIAMKKVVASG